MTAVIFKVCTNTALISDMQVATTVSGLTTVSEKIHSSSSLCVNQFNQSINQSVSQCAKSESWHRRQSWRLYLFDVSVNWLL